MRFLLCLLCAASGFAADPQAATLTGRVFDDYHRPVRSARVATMERRLVNGQQRLVAGAQATVDEAGMYRLTLPPGRYILAALPPPGLLDFTTVFPAYFQDTTDFAQARPIDLGPGEIRPFTDFLLFDVESHRLAGQVTGIPKGWGSAAVVLCSASGYTGPLQVAATEAGGRFHFDHVPAGVFDLTVTGPAADLAGLESSGCLAQSGRLRIEVAKPETIGLRIHLASPPR